jgi:hypothetical protein
VSERGLAAGKHEATVSFELTERNRELDDTL